MSHNATIMNFLNSFWNQAQEDQFDEFENNWISYTKAN